MFALALSCARLAKCLEKQNSTVLNAWETVRRGIRVPADQIDSRFPHTAFKPTAPFRRVSSSQRPIALARHCYTHARMAGRVNDPPKSEDQYRLPTNVKPAHYDLTIRTDLKALKFDGYVTTQYVLATLSTRRN